jgi:hypothetical protein
VRFLVTGGTGKVGNAVARRLVERGDEVVALVRDVAAAREVLPTGVRLVPGDVTHPATIHEAVRGADGVFNCMGIYEQWLPDAGRFEQVNAQGALNVITAARQAGARRAVHTSTFDVFHAERGGSMTEAQLADYPKGTVYERSKQHAEELVLARGRWNRGRDRQPDQHLRAGTLGCHRPRRRDARCDPPPAARTAAWRNDPRLRRRRRRRPSGRLRARQARRALHPRGRLREHA